LGPSRDGSVVLDIGGNIGALVLWVPADLCGEELELTPLDPAMKKVHTEVRERNLEAGVVAAAVYPQLAEGDYEIDRSAQRVSIVGGQITEVNFERVNS
jgi:hypothetical protein